MPSSGDGGLGSALVGEKLMVNQRQVAVTKLLGEGTWVYDGSTEKLHGSCVAQLLLLFSMF